MGKASVLGERKDLRGQENKRIDVQWDRLCGLSHFLWRQCGRKRKLQGGTRAPHWISLSPPLEPIASKESAKNMSNASYRPFAKSCFQHSQLLRSSFLRLQDAMLIEMALTSYIHAGRFSCEHEIYLQECTSEL